MASTPEKLKTVLDTIEEPSEDDLAMIENLIAFAPKLLPRMIGEQIYAKAVVLTKETPGRKHAIPEERYGDICDEVLSLVRVKCSLRECEKKSRVTTSAALGEYSKGANRFELMLYTTLRLN